MCLTLKIDYAFPKDSVMFYSFCKHSLWKSAWYIVGIQ